MQEISVTINDQCSFNCKYCFKKSDQKYSLVKSVGCVNKLISKDTENIHFHIPEISNDDERLILELIETFYGKFKMVIHINMTMTNIAFLEKIKEGYKGVAIVAIYNSSMTSDKSKAISIFLDTAKWYRHLNIIPYFVFFEETMSEAETLNKLIEDNKYIDRAFFKFTTTSYLKLCEKIRLKVSNLSTNVAKCATCKSV